MAGFAPLKLIAQGEEDVTVLSAALQDAVAQIGDFTFEPRARRFTIVFNRYRWEASRERGAGERVRTALQAGSVLAAKSRNLRQGAPDAVVSLLAVSFEPDRERDAPGGQLIFTFSGDGELRLSVDCIDLALADVSEPWRARARPGHETGDDAAKGKAGQ